MNNILAMNKFNKQEFYDFISYIFMFLIMVSLVLTKILDTMNLIFFISIVVFFVFRSKFVLDNNYIKLLIYVFFLYFVLGISNVFFNTFSIKYFFEEFNERVASIVSVAFFLYILIKVKPKNYTLLFSSYGLSIGVLLVIILEYLDH